MAGLLGDELKDVGAEIKKLVSKQEKVEEALEGRGAYLGTTDHVRATELQIMCEAYRPYRATECWILGFSGHSLDVLNYFSAMSWHIVGM